MKQFVLFIIFILLVNNLKAAKNVSPFRFIILGAAIVGTELVYNVVNLFKGEEEDISIEKKDTNTLKNKEKINKEAELKKLLAPSKLFEIIATTNIIVGTDVILTNILIQTQIKKMLTITNIITNGSVIQKTNKEKEEYQTDTKEEQSITITNCKTHKVYKFKNDLINYYEIGKTYFKVDEKLKAKEFLLKTIAFSIKKEEAIKFLIRNYKMLRKKILNESKKYKK